MSYQRILVHLDDSEAGRKRFQSAQKLAQQFQATVNALYVQTAAPAVSTFSEVSAMSVSPQLTAETQKHQELEEERLASVREFLSKQSEVSTHLQVFQEPLGESLLRYCRCHDLIILGTEFNFLDQALISLFGSLARIATDSGRPLLVLPDDCQFNLPFMQGVLHWNGSQESARALSDALPLLAHCQSMTTLMTEPLESPADWPETEQSALAAYLHSHSIQSNFHTALKDKQEAGLWILEQAAEEASSLVVLGAYGHSKLDELMHGSLTRKLLKESPVPLLLSH